MAELIDLKEEPQLVERALLVGIRKTDETQEYAEGLLDELGELVKNLGIGVVGGEIVKLREVNPHYLVGSGKFKEILEKARQAEADCIVLDDELSPAQQRNWEREAGVSVVNRQEIILDIFAQRAQTKEARLQVELAKLEYSLPRLRKAWSHLSRQRGGGVTQRGEGESQLEVDRRMVRKRITSIKRELADISKTRQLQRKQRYGSGVFKVSLAGYTNAGKSSLLNTITDSDVLSYDKLFATLDSTTRQLVLPEGREITLTDTVGFIQKLPTKLIEAFKSTLDEINGANLILHVIDSSDPNAAAQIDVVNLVLEQIGAEEIPRLEVFNKIDLLEEGQLNALQSRYPQALFISTLTKEGITELIKRIGLVAASQEVLKEVLIPYEKGDLVSLAHKRCTILNEQYTENGTRMSIRIAPEFINRFEPFEVTCN